MRYLPKDTVEPVCPEHVRDHNILARIVPRKLPKPPPGGASNECFIRYKAQWRKCVEALYTRTIRANYFLGEAEPGWYIIPVDYWVLEGGASGKTKGLRTIFEEAQRITIEARRGYIVDHGLSHKARAFAPELSLDWELRAIEDDVAHNTRRPMLGYAAALYWHIHGEGRRIGRNSAIRGLPRLLRDTNQIDNGYGSGWTSSTMER